MPRGDYGPGRTYTAEEKATAIGLAASIGPHKAAQQLGYPTATVARWTHQPAASEVIRAVEVTIAQRLEEAASLALEAVTEGLRDPKARLGDRARALDVLATQANLAAGRATGNLSITTERSVLDQAIDAANVEMTDEQREAFKGWVAVTLEDWLASHEDPIAYARKLGERVIRDDPREVRVAFATTVFRGLTGPEREAVADELDRDPGRVFGWLGNVADRFDAYDPRWYDGTLTRAADRKPKELTGG